VSFVCPKSELVRLINTYLVTINATEALHKISIPYNHIGVAFALVIFCPIIRFSHPTFQLGLINYDVQ